MKRLVILFLAVATSCVTKKNDALIKALEDSTISMRGTIVEVPGYDFRYDYYDVHEADSHFKYLSKKGYQGGGPSWKGITYGALKMSDPSLLDKIRFDEEAEGLAIWSSDKETLIKIGRLINVVKSDSSILDQCIAVANSHFQME